MPVTPLPLELVNIALDLIQRHSIQRSDHEGKKFEWAYAPHDAIDWQDFKDKAFYDLQSVQTPTIEDACGVIDRALMRLGDNHSLLTYPSFERSVVPNYVANIDPRNDSRFTWAFHKKNWHTSIEAVASKEKDSVNFVEPKLCYRGDILVVSVPGFFLARDSSQRKIYQETLRHGLLQAAEKPLKGIVVDLLENGGGDMHPMLLGLSPILGPQTLGYFSTQSGEQAWHINYGQNKSDIVSADDPRNFPLFDIPVAVLAGPGTCSSGEIIFLSLRGRANTASLGLETYGASSGNKSFFLTEDGKLQMHLCASVSLDRNHQGSGNGKKAFDGGKIGVDIKSNSPLDDAITWLKSAAPPVKPTLSVSNNSLRAGKLGI